MTELTFHALQEAPSLYAAEAGHLRYVVHKQGSRTWRVSLETLLPGRRNIWRQLHADERPTRREALVVARNWHAWAPICGQCGRQH